jgi:GNAT superfamily N-acetyltransferase
MALRDATPDDVPQLVLLARQFWELSDFTDLTFSDDHMATFMADAIRAPWWLLVVSEDADGIHGFIIGHIEPSSFGPDVIGMQDYLFVHPAKQGTRAGLRLMRSFEEWSDVMGAKQLHFAPVANGYDERWHRVTESLGFQRRGTHYVKPMGRGR